MTECDSGNRREALAELVLKKGGTLTYAGRLLISREVDGERRLYDEQDRLWGVDDAPPLPPKASIQQAGARVISEIPASNQS